MKVRKKIERKKAFVKSARGLKNRKKSIDITSESIKLVPPTSAALSASASSDNFPITGSPRIDRDNRSRIGFGKRKALRRNSVDSQTNAQQSKEKHKRKEHPIKHIS